MEIEEPDVNFLVFLTITLGEYTVDRISRFWYWNRNWNSLFWCKRFSSEPAVIRPNSTIQLWSQVKSWTNFCRTLKNKSDRKWPRRCALGMVIVFDSAGAAFAVVAHRRHSISHSKKIDIFSHLSKSLSNRLDSTMTSILKYGMAMQSLDLTVHNNDNEH